MFSQYLLASTRRNVELAPVQRFKSILQALCCELISLFHDFPRRLVSW